MFIKRHLINKIMIKRVGISFIISCFAILPLQFSAHSQESFPKEAYLSLQDSYELLSFLGKGEKSQVFLAKDREGELVAIKCMYSRAQLQETFTPEYLDTIFDLDGSSLIARREMFIGQQLDHHNIIRINKMDMIWDSNSGEVRECLVMEYVKGKTLNQMPRKSQTNRQALQNALSLIDALKFSFNKHWIHHDLYSSNIMFDERQQIKLIDLDSFDDLSDNKDEITHVEYLDAVIFTIQQVLALGNFEDHSLDAMSETLRNILYCSPYSEQLKQLISSQSAPLFSSVLDEMTTALSQKLGIEQESEHSH